MALITFFTVFIQVCEQCPNVKYEREGYFITVDIEKGMQDGQVSFRPSILNNNFQLPACVAVLLFSIVLSVSLQSCTKDHILSVTFQL